ncbi:MAG: GNAT family N-acetyltransferase [Cyclobacteriaceae bacterium]|nr:GNAT family N-acetyltransferase [Cyclobacteriaceae bacterium]
MHLILNITYRTDATISNTQFIDILKRSTLDKRRPVDNPDRIQKMLDHGNILVTAWHGDLLVGVSRALSDFSFCCYLSDLAVDTNYQQKGIGKKLIEKTHLVAGHLTTLILLAAPAAAAYYPKIGMEQFTDCYIIRRK